MGGGPAACALVELAPLLCHCLGRSRLSKKRSKSLSNRWDVERRHDLGTIGYQAEGREAWVVSCLLTGTGPGVLSAAATVKPDQAAAEILHGMSTTTVDEPAAAQRAYYPGDDR
jgi:hypothetical protein